MDAVMRQNIGLSFGGGCAMTAHGWKDKRLATLRLPIVDHGADYGRDVGDAPASDSQGDACARFKARTECGSAELTLNLASDVGNGAIGEVLPDREQFREFHFFQNTPGQRRMLAG